MVGAGFRCGFRRQRNHYRVDRQHSGCIRIGENRYAYNPQAVEQVWSASYAGYTGSDQHFICRIILFSVLKIQLSTKRITL